MRSRINTINRIVVNVLTSLREGLARRAVPAVTVGTPPRAGYWIFRLLTTSRTPDTPRASSVARALAASFSTFPVR